MIVDINNLPEYWPTHRHDEEFWEHLGRALATFGFLEETLAKAILSFEGNQTVNVSEAEEKISELLNALERKMQKTITDTLAPLIRTYKESVYAHCSDDSKLTKDHIDQLTEDLKGVADYRNVLCHASWRVPNDKGQSQPFFIRRNNGAHEVFDMKVDIGLLKQIQKHTTKLICDIINTVTIMGWEFPGASPNKKQYD